MTANIGPGERRKRRRLGFAMLVVGVALAVVLVLTGVARPWRITLFIPFWIGALGFFQAREKT